MENISTIGIRVIQTHVSGPQEFSKINKTNSGQEFASEFLKKKSEIKEASRLENRLENVKPAVHKIQSENKRMSVSDVIQSFSRTWNSSNQKLTQTMEALPAQSKPFFEAQLLMSKVTLDSQIITRVADTMGASVRKLLQMGSN